MQVILFATSVCYHEANHPTTLAEKNECFRVGFFQLLTLKAIWSSLLQTKTQREPQSPIILFIKNALLMAFSHSFITNK